jgi:hypothetical protein
MLPVPKIKMKQVMAIIGKEEALKTQRKLKQI